MFLLILAHYFRVFLITLRVNGVISVSGVMRHMSRPFVTENGFYFDEFRMKSLIDLIGIKEKFASIATSCGPYKISSIFFHFDH